MALLGHGGTLNVVNSIVGDNLQFGIDNDIDPDPTVSYSDIFTPGGTNTRGFANPIGSNHNISLDPKFVNAESANYRLSFFSPAIDAADGTAAPTTDSVGAPRFDAPSTANTGVATSTGEFADMGAFEFVEGANSDLDLTVTVASAPAEARAGDLVPVQWTVRNIGTGVVFRPPHEGGLFRQLRGRTWWRHLVRRPVVGHVRLVRIILHQSEDRLRSRSSLVPTDSHRSANRESSMASGYETDSGWQRRVTFAL